MWKNPIALITNAFTYNSRVWFSVYFSGKWWYFLPVLADTWVSIACRNLNFWNVWIRFLSYIFGAILRYWLIKNAYLSELQKHNIMKVETCKMYTSWQKCRYYKCKKLNLKCKCKTKIKWDNFIWAVNVEDRTRLFHIYKEALEQFNNSSMGYVGPLAMLLVNL